MLGLPGLPELLELPAAHLPPINGCFSSRAPDLPGICCNLAGSAPWLGRHSLPDAGWEEGLSVGDPLLGLGVQRSWEGSFGRIFAKAAVLVLGLKQHRGVPTLWLSQLLPPSCCVHLQGDLRRSCVGLGPTNIH